MTTHNANVSTLLNTTSNEEEFSIPLDLTDILSICQEFNKLGLQIQTQIENIIELGVEEAIKSGYINQQSLPHIKNFLNVVCQNPYFGDAIFQAKEAIMAISEYEAKLVSLVMN